MKWCLLIHVSLTFWVLIDGLGRKGNSLLWVMGTLIFGPFIVPLYMAERPLKVGESRPTRITRCVIQGMAIFWTVLMALFDMWGMKITSPSHTASHAVIEEENLEYKLAVLNARSNIHKDDGTVTHFRFLLDQLSQSYMEDRREIANISVIASSRMKACGLDESLLNIMEGLNGLLVTRNQKNKRYAELMTDYVMLRTFGQSYREAIEDLQAKNRGY